MSMHRTSNHRNVSHDRNNNDNKTWNIKTHQSVKSDIRVEVHNKDNRDNNTMNNKAADMVVPIVADSNNIVEAMMIIRHNNIEDRNMMRIMMHHLHRMVITHAVIDNAHRNIIMRHIMNSLVAMADNTMAIGDTDNNSHSREDNIDNNNEDMVVATEADIALKTDNNKAKDRKLGLAHIWILRV